MNTEALLIARTDGWGEVGIFCIKLRGCTHITISRIEGGWSLKIYLYDNMGGSRSELGQFGEWVLHFCIIYFTGSGLIFFYIKRGGGKKNISHILQGVGGSQKVKIWYRYMCTAPKRKINQNPNYNLVVFFEDFDMYFFISLFEISRISDILSENLKTQHKTLVFVFHMVSIY